MLSDEVLTLLIDYLCALDQDNSVRVVIITGEEGEFFCGGVFNPLQMAELSHEQIRTRRRRANELFDRLEALMHPVMAAVNGRAQAGGLRWPWLVISVWRLPMLPFRCPRTLGGCFPGLEGLYVYRA